MIGIPLGLIAANATEWLIHKHVLHGLGKHKESFWSFHWYEHHRAARRNGHTDEDYTRSPLRWNAQGKEIVALAAGGVVLAPLFPVAPLFTATLFYCGARYYQIHRRSHLDPEWARQHVPWHYDHHMGPHQDANWCVTRPWFDHLMGTREPYVGTEREASDQQRAERLEERRRAA